MLTRLITRHYCHFHWKINRYKLKKRIEHSLEDGTIALSSDGSISMGLATDESSQDPSCPIFKETWSERRRRHAAARNAVNVMMVSAFEEDEPPTTQLTEHPPTTSSEGITRTMALDMSTSTPSNTSADVAAQSALELERSASAPTHRTEHSY